MRPSVGGSAGQNNHIFSQARGRRRDKVGWVTTTERYGRERLGSLPRPRVSKANTVRVFRLFPRPSR